MGRAPLGSCCPLPLPAGSQVCGGSGRGPGHCCGFFQVRGVPLHKCLCELPQASWLNWLSRKEGSRVSGRALWEKSARKWGKSLSTKVGWQVLGLE